MRIAVVRNLHANLRAFDAAVLGGSLGGAFGSCHAPASLRGGRRGARFRACPVARREMP